MALVVQKYGGTSVGDIDQIKRVAGHIAATRRAGNDVVVVVSAMGGTTDHLLELAGQLANPPAERELDILLTTGECAASALLAMAVQAHGVPAHALTGWQAGVITTPAHGKARIITIRPDRVHRELARGLVVLVAGFQGVCQPDRHRPDHDLTTLGRGGSDTTAVALAAALNAEVCEIYTDVDGVYTADPRLVPDAVRLQHVSYDDMLELAAGGARVLVPRCVEYARRHGVTVHVRSSRHITPATTPGTLVCDPTGDPTMEHALITGVTHDRSQARIIVTGVPDCGQTTARIFRILANAHTELDMVTRSASRQHTGQVDITFTLPRHDGPAVVTALHNHRTDIGFDQVRYDEHVGTVSLVGTGIRSHPGLVAAFCETLTAAGMTIEIMSTSPARACVLCPDSEVETAVCALHDAFGPHLPAGARNPVVPHHAGALR